MRSPRAQFTLRVDPLTKAKIKAISWLRGTSDNEAIEQFILTSLATIEASLNADDRFMYERMTRRTGSKS